MDGDLWVDFFYLFDLDCDSCYVLVGLSVEGRGGFVVWAEEEGGWGFEGGDSLIFIEIILATYGGLKAFGLLIRFTIQKVYPYLNYS